MPVFHLLLPTSNIFLLLILLHIVQIHNYSNLQSFPPMVVRRPATTQACFLLTAVRPFPSSPYDPFMLIGLQNAIGSTNPGLRSNFFPYLVIMSLSQSAIVEITIGDNPARSRKHVPETRVECCDSFFYLLSAEGSSLS